MKQKSLFKNSIYNVLYKCLNVIFPLITSMYASRILLSEGIGKVASAQNIVLYFTTIASLGIPTYGIKKIAESRDNKEALSTAFLELFIINFISSLICSFAYYAMIFTFNFYQSRIALYIVCGLNTIFNIFNVDWFYQGIEEYRYIMMRSMAIKIISLIMLFILVRTSDDYVYYALISSLALVFNYLFNIIHIRKLITLHGLAKLTIHQHLKPVFILLAASIAVEIYTLADTTMLTAFCGDRIVGLYSNSMKVIKIVRNLVVSICAVFLPRLSYYYSQGDHIQFDSLVARGIKILFVLTLPTTVGIILVSDSMIPVMFGSSFNDAIITTKILSVSVVTVAFSSFFGNQVLVTVGKEKQMMYSTFLGAIINVILNAILIKSFQQNGAAVASVITEASVTLFQIICVRKLINPNLNGRFVSSTVFSALFMIVCVLPIKLLNLSLIKELFISVIVGSVVYFLCLYITKNEMIDLFIHKLFPKLRRK